MYFSVKTQLSAEQAADKLRQSIQQSHYQLLTELDLNDQLNDLSDSTNTPIKVFEIANAKRMDDAINLDPRMAMIMPLRLAIYEEKGETRIGTLKPHLLMASVTTRLSFLDIAKVMENDLKDIIHDALDLPQAA